jgi:hypothetical protein
VSYAPSGQFDTKILLEIVGNQFSAPFTPSFSSCPTIEMCTCPSPPPCVLEEKASEACPSPPPCPRFEEETLKSEVCSNSSSEPTIASPPSFSIGLLHPYGFFSHGMALIAGALLGVGVLRLLNPSMFAKKVRVLSVFKNKFYFQLILPSNGWFNSRHGRRQKAKKIYVLPPNVQTVQVEPDYVPPRPPAPKFVAPPPPPSITVAVDVEETQLREIRGREVRTRGESWNTDRFYSIINDGVDVNDDDDDDASTETADSNARFGNF